MTCAVSSAERVLVGLELHLLEEPRERRLVDAGTVLLGGADELREVLDPAARLDRALGLVRLDRPRPLEHALHELVDLELLRRRHERLDGRPEAPDRACARGRDPGRLRVRRRVPQRDPERRRVRDEPLDRGVADPPPRPVGDPHQRDGVVRVVEQGQVGDGVLDLGALVEARPADHLVRHSLADEHVLQHARLGVRPVEDRDLGGRVPGLDETRDLGRDEACLRVLVLDLDDLDRVALPELRPEPLRLAVAVVVDDRVRRPEDRVRRAVVLLERHGVRPAEVLLEVEDVADVRAAEGVDRLVRIADGEDVAVLGGEQLQEPVLRVVRVLVLVDEDVAEGGLPALEGLGEALEHVDGEHQHVVEVDGVRGEQPALVELVHLGDGLVPERGDARRVLLGRDEQVLGVGDLRVDPARREALRILAELLEARLHDAHLVGLVVDRERRAVPEPLGLAAQDPPAGRVEGEDPDRAGGAAEDALEPLAHLGRGLVRERDREDLVRLHAVRADQVSHTVREDASLPRPRPGDDEERPVDVEHRLALGRIEAGEELLVGRDGHAIDASRGLRRNPGPCPSRPWLRTWHA